MSEWISVKDELPISLDEIKVYGGMEVLVVVGGKTETCDFSYGHYLSLGLSLEASIMLT